MFNSGNTTLKFSNKRRRYENSTQSCYLNESKTAGYSYAEKIIGMIGENLVINYYNFSPTANSHQSALVHMTGKKFYVYFASMNSLHYESSPDEVLKYACEKSGHGDLRKNAIFKFQKNSAKNRAFLEALDEKIENAKKEKKRIAARNRLFNKIYKEDFATLENYKKAIIKAKTLDYLRIGWSYIIAEHVRPFRLKRPEGYLVQLWSKDKDLAASVVSIDEVLSELLDVAAAALEGKELLGGLDE